MPRKNESSLEELNSRKDDLTGRVSGIVSGRLRWRAGLGVGAGSGAEQLRGTVEPDHARGLAIGRRDGGLRRVNQGTRMGDAADRTATIMGLGLAGLIALAGGRRIVVTNDG